MTAKNATHSVTVYWRDGRAATKEELPPKQANALRFACISDTHGKVAQFATEAFLLLPESDYVIHAGDFTVRLLELLIVFFTFILQGHWNEQADERIWRFLSLCEASRHCNCRKP